MAEDRDKTHSRKLLGKTVVSQSGKRFGEVGNLIFEVRSGELLQISLKNPTVHCEGFNLDRASSGDLLVPFSSVVAIGDFVVLEEKDIV